MEEEEETILVLRVRCTTEAAEGIEAALVQCVEGLDGVQDFGFENEDPDGEDYE